MASATKRSKDVEWQRKRQDILQEREKTRAEIDLSRKNATAEVPVPVPAPETKEPGKLTKVIAGAGKVLGAGMDVLQGKDVGGIKTGLGERKDVFAGTVPLGPSGSPMEVTKLIKAGVIAPGNSLEALAGAKVFGALDKAKNFIVNAAKTKAGIAAITGTAAFSGVMTWMASDNIISAMNIFTRDIAANVKFGSMTPEDGIAKLNEAQGFVDGARSFININTMVNPLLWPFRGIIMSNVDAAQFVIDTKRTEIGGQPVVPLEQ